MAGSIGWWHVGQRGASEAIGGPQGAGGGTSVARRASSLSKLAFSAASELQLKWKFAVPGLGGSTGGGVSVSRGFEASSAVEGGVPGSGVLGVTIVDLPRRVFSSRSLARRSRPTGCRVRI